jgi:hypothetical protein
MNRNIIHIIFTIFLLFIFSTAVYSQKFTGGLAAGITGSQVDGDTYSGYNKAGLTAGAWVNVSVNEHSAFQMGLNYIMKGSQHNPKTDQGETDYLRIRLGYAEMPILYQYKMKSGFYLEVGPSLGVLLHSRFENEYGVDPNYTFQLLDIEIQEGIGFRFPNSKLRAGIRKGNSLISIQKGANHIGRNTIFGYGQFNNVLAIELYYTL